MTADLEGKNIIITGSNTGIGRATADALARRGARIFFACRSKAKTQPVIDQMIKDTGNPKLEFLELDLGKLSAVKASAEAFLALNLPLHVLINNAGLGRAHGLTADGYELIFGTNHLGPFLFTLLLHPALKAAGTSRVVNVASRAHERAGPIDFEHLREPYHGFGGMPEYGRSKLANVLFANELARRWKADGVHTYSLHPGVVASDIWRKVPQPLRAIMTSMMITVQQGAVASVRCAGSPEVANETGRYYGQDGQIRKHNPLADDQALATKLWNYSEEQVRQYLK